MSPHDPRHGTNAGATAHYATGTPLCDPCRRAKSRTAKAAHVAREQGRPLTVPLGKAAHAIVVSTLVPQLSRTSGVNRETLRHLAKNGSPETMVRRRTRDAILSTSSARTVSVIGTRRRIQSLHALGWTCRDIADLAGVSREAVAAQRDRTDRGQIRSEFAEGIADAFAALSARLPDERSPKAREHATKARQRAAFNGWPPPLAWDNIDDPNEQPKGTTNGPRVTGRPSTIAARIEDFDFLVDQGESEENAAARIGVKLSSFRDERRRYEREKGGAA